jgi:lipoate synthase
MQQEYPIEGETLVYLSDKEMLDEVSKWYKPKWMSKYIGGYCTPSNKHIYIKESRKYDDFLLAHERGHLCGFGHTWMPTIMFPSYIGRILYIYYPYKRKY